MTECSAALQLKGWRSKCYNHFGAAYVVVGDDGIVRYAFPCLRYVLYPILTSNCTDTWNDSNPSEIILRKRSDRLTSNLARHVSICEPKITASTQLITAFARGATYTKAKFRYTLAMWIARCHRPYRIVEDEEFIELLRMLLSTVGIPSANTLSNDVKEIFLMARKNVAKQLRVSVRPLMHKHKLIVILSTLGLPGHAPHWSRRMDVSEYHLISWRHRVLCGRWEDEIVSSGFHQVMSILPSASSLVWHPKPDTILQADEESHGQVLGCKGRRVCERLRNRSKGTPSPCVIISYLAQALNKF